ncbi:Ribosomal RNA small subunit methyltransferase G [Porphyridium purpureum]|uniref:Ribosomal RNA small subunit methyltransferase G n=1 Tax=Porphyridium purpureum TaxID=35688 RepID=A0A5J4Z8A6_PORPP|nr:Ribosomal RNA small subunit methyltransferase G [Porphyridium purpureum]|eukprot:POR7759..scf295_1
MAVVSATMANMLAFSWHGFPVLLAPPIAAATAAHCPVRRPRARSARRCMCARARRDDDWLVDPATDSATRSKNKPAVRKAEAAPRESQTEDGASERRTAPRGAAKKERAPQPLLQFRSGRTYEQVYEDALSQCVQNPTLTAVQKGLLDRYCEELLEWNATRCNLTAVRTRDGVYIKFIADSLTLVPVLDSLARSIIEQTGDKQGRPLDVLDLGTGGGAPGLILAIARPQYAMTLVDSVAKKIAFCQHFADTNRASLGNVRTLVNRAEALGRSAEHREVHDCVVCRAVGELRSLVELAAPLLRVGGWLIAQKALSRDHREIKEASNALKLLGCEVHAVHEVTSIDGDSAIDDERYRAIVVVRKAQRTDLLYPRIDGTPAKSPL